MGNTAVQKHEKRIVVKTNHTRNIAFIVLAHSNCEQLNFFVQQLLSYSGSYIFVHIDKKAPYGSESVIKNDRIFVGDERIDGKWGDISLVDIMISQLKRVVSSEIHFEYVSLHSGADLAVRPIQSFVEHLTQTDKDVYVECSKLPAKNWGHGGGLERVALYYPSFFRQRVGRRHPIRFLRIAYQMAYEHRIIPGLNNTLTNDTLYGGSQWFTCTYIIAADAIRYINMNQDYIERFKHSLIPDEIVFATLFNKLCSEDRIERSNNLRYIDWSNGNPIKLGGPRTLTMGDVSRIDNSDKFFARKFESTEDLVVIQHYLAMTGNDSI